MMTNMLEFGYTKSLRRENQHIWLQKTSTFGCRKPPHLAAENIHFLPQKNEHILSQKFLGEVIIWFTNYAIWGQT